MTTYTFSDPALGSWSEVRARDSVTRYRRSGVGQSVLLLDGEGGASLWPELMHVLGGNFRLIVPNLPPGGPSEYAALASFLEGLGTSGVSVIASSSYCVPALDLVLRGVDQVTRLVLVPDGDSDDPANTSFTTTAGPGLVPLLVVWRGMSASDALPSIARFVSGVDAR